MKLGLFPQHFATPLGLSALLDSLSLSSLTVVMNMSDFSPARLRRAAALKERLEKLHRKLASILGSAAPAPVGRSKKHKRSAAVRARMSAAQTARWAKLKGKTKPAESPRKKKK